MQLGDLSAVRLLIVGDVMLDRYWFGDVSRISPEAPVPVVKVERSEERPGGAANVARNAAALGAKVSLLALVGDDEPGVSLKRLMSEGGIDASLQVDEAVTTTVKLRVIGRQQQLLRIDFETTPSHEALRAKLSEFERRLPDCDAVVFSDYGKGGLTHIGEMIRLARAAGKIVLVDPKGDDYACYAGATIITPLETLLTQQITLQVDTAQPKRYPFSWCSPIGCVSRVGFTQAEIDVATAIPTWSSIRDSIRLPTRFTAIAPSAINIGVRVSPRAWKPGVSTFTSM